ncbi:MAG: hypothetical protein K0R34_668 [Herbinix sp.]|jgi:uncharacterized protein YukE|nr:hypothetical protein [Herbinix sp.]
MADITFNPIFLEGLITDMQGVKAEMDSVITETQKLHTDIESVYKGIATAGLDESFTPLLQHLNGFSSFCEVTIEYFQYVIAAASAEDAAIAKSLTK